MNVFKKENMINLSALQETHFEYKETNVLKGSKKIVTIAGIAVSVSDKVDFKSTIVMRDKEELHIFIKILTHQ